MAFVECADDFIEAFNEPPLSEDKACELLVIKRAKLQRFRERW